MNQVRVILTAGCLVFTSLSAKAAPSPVRWTAPTLAIGAAAQPSKKDILARLKLLQNQQIIESSELENAIRKQLSETMTMDVSGDDLNVATHRTGLVTKKIDELNKRRNELNARREIVDRLVFQVDSKWSNQKLQDFLAQTFIEMASTDLADGRDNRLWKEFTYLSMVVREVSDANEDMMGLVEGYLKFSSVLEPKTPGEFLASRNYTNGVESQMAHASSRDSLGDGIGPAKSELTSKQNFIFTVKSSLPSVEAVGATSSSTTQSASDLTTTPAAASAAPPVKSNSQPN